MQIRSLFTTLPKGKWRASKSMPRAILLLLISQAFNSGKTLCIYGSCEKSEQSLVFDHLKEIKQERQVHHVLNAPTWAPPMAPPPLGPHCTLAVPGSMENCWEAEVVLRIYSLAQLTRLPTTFTWSPHLPLRIPSCGNTRIRVTNSGNFGLNFLPYWRKSQLVGGFLNREKQMPICQV